MQVLRSGTAEGYVDKWKACGQNRALKRSMAAQTLWMQSKYNGGGDPTLSRGGDAAILSVLADMKWPYSKGALKQSPRDSLHPANLFSGSHFHQPSGHTAHTTLKAVDCGQRYSLCPRRALGSFTVHTAS